MADILQTIFLDALLRTIIFSHALQISMTFVPEGPINKSALVQVMAWRPTGDKPLSEPMMDYLLTVIKYVTQPRWVILRCIYWGFSTTSWTHRPWYLGTLMDGIGSGNGLLPDGTKTLSEPIILINPWGLWQLDNDMLQDIVEGWEMYSPFSIWNVKNSTSDTMISMLLVAYSGKMTEIK